MVRKEAGAGGSALCVWFERACMGEGGDDRSKGVGLTDSRLGGRGSKQCISEQGALRGGYGAAAVAARKEWGSERQCE